MAKPKAAAGAGPLPGPPPGGPLPNNPIVGTSSAGVGVKGESNTSIGVYGNSIGLLGAGSPSDGVLGVGQNGVHGQSGIQGGSGVLGEHVWTGVGVTGTSASGHGVHGVNSKGNPGQPPSVGVGIWGESDNGVGVYGASGTFEGVWGASASGHGVHGVNSKGNPGQPPPVGTGVWGESDNGVGVYGASGASEGVWGTSTGSAGVYGVSKQWDGVRGESQAPNKSGVSAVNNSGGYGVWASGTPAGYFNGDVQVTGDVTLINGDCAEDFNISDGTQIEPGTVMVIEGGDALQMSHSAYDKRVAGVISGARDLKPAIILGKQRSQNVRMPLALLGKAYCKVDASYSPVEVGDLLTTSPTPGHAMKATDPTRAFGAVIGKALQPLAEGQELIPILIALQ